MKSIMKRFFALLISCSVAAGMYVMPSYAEDAEFAAVCAVENGIYSISGRGNGDRINVIINPAFREHKKADSTRFGRFPQNASIIITLPTAALSASGKGSKSHNFLSAAFASSPVFFIYYISPQKICQ